MRVSANQDVCIGAGLCVLSAPAVFDQDEVSGLVVVLDENPVGASAEVAHAAQDCPSRAITVVNDDDVA